MLSNFRRHGAAISAVAALSLGLAACSTDTPEAAGSETDDMDSALTLTPVGDACSAIDPDGPGSSEGMASELVATAASNNPLLTTLVAAVGAAGLGDTLNGLEAATVFAPYNPAFEAFSEEELNGLLADTDTLTSVLTLHVVGENLLLDDLESRGSVTTVNGQDISFDFSDGDLPTVTASNTANVICGNVQTANATVHLIDTVLMPTAGEDMGDMDSALTLQPVGEACAAIDPDGPGSSEGMASELVATAASGNPLLTTLVAAVGAAGLGDTLNGLEAATVFAPYNPAFEAFTEDELNALLADTDTLTAVLTTHVVGGNMTLADLEAAGTVTSVQGATLTLDFAAGVEAGLPTVSATNTANVLCGNIQTANATVHLIDTVLMP